MRYWCKDQLEGGMILSLGKFTTLCMLLQRLLRLQHDSLSALMTQKKRSVAEYEVPLTTLKRKKCSQILTQMESATWTIAGHGSRVSGN